MRIALVCPYSLSAPGGVQGQVLGLARALGTLGHEAMVVAPADGPVVVPEASTEILVAGRPLPIPANGSVAPVALGPFAAARAVRSINGGGIDVVHLHEPLAPGAGYACLVRCAQPIVGTFHRAGASTAYRILGPLARRAAGRLDIRCAVSPEAESTARQALGGSYEIVGNGVEVDRFAHVRPWPTDGPTVLFVGRHEKRKGLGLLLEAFASVAAQEPTATLWVVGSGPETGALQGRMPAGLRVQWLGRVDDAELVARLRGADVLCAPALGGESFGMVLLEAMAARTAVVASAIPGYAFVARDHARLVPPGDAGALALALTAAVGDAVAGTGASAAASLDEAEAHAESWSMARLAERYLALYQSAVGLRQSAG